MPVRPWISVARLWDDATHTARRKREGVRLRLARAPIRIRISRLEHGCWEELLAREYQPKGKIGERNCLAFDLFDQCRHRLRRPLLVVGSPYCLADDFLHQVLARDATVAASIPPRAAREMMDIQNWSILSSTNWSRYQSSAGASLMPIALGELEGQLFVFDSEPVPLPRRGTKFLAYFGPKARLNELARVATYPKGTIYRSPNSIGSTPPRRKRKISSMPSQRPNMAVALQQDARLSSFGASVSSCSDNRTKRFLFVDIFAGSGGLSLGFLSATNAQYELCLAIDISPICIKTLTNNLTGLKGRQGITGSVHSNAIRIADLSQCKTVDHILSPALNCRSIDVLVGGPPCQPFSSARRRPASRSEAQLIYSFARAVDLVQPSVFILENVQGILWRDSSGASPAWKLMQRMIKGGYRVATRVLDAVWFGAAQHRARAFIVGLHPRIGTNIDPEDAFPSPHYTGSQTRPYKTVFDSISDLPEIPNGHSCLDIPACADSSNGDNMPSARVLDHVTSCHADYVLDRFRRIKPGENWTAIQDMMTNYSRKERTHSNIYRRLEWNKPSVTLGHYRKSMLIHPDQDRGLSLREALRLQSFPDWYRLWGHEEHLAIGLDRKQQLLANAVPPVLARAIAEQIVRLLEDGRPNH